MAICSNSFNISVFVQDAKDKQPGSLEPAEWLAAMEPRTGRKVLCVENVDNAIYGNAFIISRQGNKYQ